MVYTAHGFHFFKGAPLKNWLLFYPAERFLSRYTDLLITINGEDYARARGFHAKKAALVNGVGVDLSRFGAAPERDAVRDALGIARDAHVVINVGEHIPRKNHETVLRAVSGLPGVHVLFCGVGEKQDELEALARELGMESRAHFLGFRRDVPALLAASDVFFFPSLQEGLPVSPDGGDGRGLAVRGEQCAGQCRPCRTGRRGDARPPRDVAGLFGGYCPAAGRSGAA